jgi:iron(III) transport system permease protein
MSLRLPSTLLASIPALLLIGVFFLWPLILVLAAAFALNTAHPTLAFLGEALLNPAILEGLRNSLVTATASTLLSGLLAIPLALIADRWNFPGKGILTSLVLAPLIVPPFVGAIGMKAIFGRQGALQALLQPLGVSAGNWLGNAQLPGIILLIALHLFPILFLNVSAALTNLDSSVGEAAENLGCRGIRKFWRITLPLIFPGVFAGAVLVFLGAFTELGVPLLLGVTRILPVQIFSSLSDAASNPFPFALVILLLISSILLYAIARLFFARAGKFRGNKGSSHAPPKRLPFLPGLLCSIVFICITGLALLPSIGLVLVSFSNDWYATILPTGWTIQHFHDALSHYLALSSIQNSLCYSLLATLICLVIGTAAAWVITRRNSAWSAFLDLLLMLPLAVPGLILALGYLVQTRPGSAFSWFNPTLHPLAILSIAYAVRRIPYITRAAVAGFQQCDPTYEEAAATLGCGPWNTFRKVTLPLIASHLAAGALLVFSFAMLDVSESLLLAQRQPDYPLSKAIFSLLQMLGNGMHIACALGVWSMAFLALILTACILLLGKGLGVIFRS